MKAEHLELHDARIGSVQVKGQVCSVNFDHVAVYEPTSATTYNLISYAGVLACDGVSSVEVSGDVREVLRAEEDGALVVTASGPELRWDGGTLTLRCAEGFLEIAFRTAVLSLTTRGEVFGTWDGPLVGSTSPEA